MHKYFLLVLVTGMTFFIVACSKEKMDSPDINIVGHSVNKDVNEPSNVGLVNVIKNGKLVDFQTATIGNAFDAYSYLTKKEWKAATLKSRHVTVDFTGWFGPETLSDKDNKDGIAARGINIKFVIEPNGSYYVFMVSKLEAKADGKIYGSELREGNTVLADIYANKKIRL